MAEKIIKNYAGKIYINGDNKIIKTRPFSETVIQNGLQFWGAADPAYLTLVNGLISEAYDIRGTGQKLIQNTVVNRPTFIDNCFFIDASKLNYLISNSSYIIKEMFIVLQYSASTGNVVFTGIGTTTNVLGSINEAERHRINDTPSAFYKNLNIISVDATYTTSFQIKHSIGGSYNFNSAFNFNVGCFFGTMGAGKTIKIKEFGVYNRVLNITERLYNINALNAKYSIF